LSSPATDELNTYSRAEAFVREHQWDKGLTLLKPLLESDPKDVRALNLTGLAFTGKGDLKQANEYFQKALEVNPRFVPALKNLAINEFNEKQLVAAEQHLLMAAKDSPNDPIINLYLGELAFTQNRFQRAADLLPRAGGLLLHDPNVAAHLAVSYLSIGEKQKALDVLSSLEVEHLTPQSQFVLGFSLARVDLSDRAVPYLQAAHRSYPDSYDAGFDLALCYVSLREYSQAIEVLRGMIDRGQETTELDNVLA
jgi:tetratricopeptide (TPR) repeat protein